MFQVTGDRKYVDLAWKALDNWFFKRSGRELGGNFAREYSAELVLQYDWLYPALTSEQRASFVAKLNELFQTVLTNPSSPTAPVRTADSDQTVGTYFGLAFLFLATADHNPKAREYFSQPFVGGLDATATDRTTLRNAVADYVRMAEGGEWVEGSGYNLGTVRLLLLGAEGVRTASGRDHFPEVTRWVADAAVRPLYVLTPDLNQSYQWGDNEHPGELRGRLFEWQTTNGILAGLGGKAAPYAHDLFRRLGARYGIEGYMSAEPWARTFLVYNPYAAALPASTLPRAWYAKGQGLLTSRTGWDEGSSLFGAHAPVFQTYVDHQVSYWGDFQLYRRGVWAISHPLGYGGPPILGEGTNTMLHSGFGAMSEYRAVVGADFDPAGSFAFLAATTAGQKYADGYYLPPPTYLHEWTRSLLYLPANDRTSEAIIVFDRSHAQDPRALAHFERYSGPDREAVLAAQPKAWLLHTPVEPSSTAGGVSWALTSGDEVELTTLLPRRRSVTVVDERSLWKSTVTQGQKKWHVRVSGDSARDWDTFLNVVAVKARSAQVKVQLISSEADQIEGALVHQSGGSALAVFNATPGPQVPASPNGYGQYDDVNRATFRQAHIRRTGFTVRYTADSPTDLFVADLDPSRPWTLVVDDSRPNPLPVSESGLARTRITSPGTHVITVR